MKMQMKQLGIVGVVLALLITGLSFGQPPQGDPNERPQMGAQQPPQHEPILRGLYRIDLTDEQKGQIETILENNKEGLQAAHDAVKAAREAMAAAVEAEDEEAIRLAATDVGYAIGEDAVTRLSVVKAVKSVLTEEQLTQLAELKERAQKWMQDSKFDRGPRGGTDEVPKGGLAVQVPEVKVLIKVPSLPKMATKNRHKHRNTWPWIPSPQPGSSAGSRLNLVFLNGIRGQVLCQN